MKGRITKRSVDALKPRVRDDGSKALQVLWDTDVTGFGCLVTAAGSKSYVLQHRLRGQARGTAPKRITIGKHGDLTPDEARRIARDLLLEIKSGSDPTEQWKSRERWTVSDLARHFLDDYLPNKTKQPRASTVRNYESLIRLHIVPAFGKRQVEEVTRDDVQRLHSSLRDRPYVANRMLSAASQLFKQAERLGLRDQATNPAALVERYREQRRGAKKAVMLNAEQMKRLLEAIHLFENEHGGDPYACAAIEVAFWTGWRISEVLGLLWENFDETTGAARLLGTKTTEEEYRAVPAEAMEVLAKVQKAEGCSSVFVGRKGQLTTVKRPWHEIRKLAELEDLGELGGLRLHDLRHNVVSWDVSRGVPLEIAGKNVGHRSRQATEVYAHFAPDVLKRAVDERAQAMTRAIFKES